MSEPNTFYLRPLTAREAIEKWLDAAAKLFADQQVIANFETNISLLSLAVQAPAQHIRQRSDVQKILTLLSNESFNAECTKFGIALHNSHPQHSIAYTVSQDGLYGNITIHNVNQLDTTVHYYKILSEIFTFTPKTVLLIGNLPRAQQEAIKYHDSVLVQLREEISKIAQFNLNQTKEQSEFLRKATVELEERARRRDEEFEQKRKYMEEASLAREKAIEENNRQKLIEIENREEEHKRKVAAVDARENMVVRRQLLKDITQLITEQKEFSLSKSVTEKRKHVHSICLGSMVFALVWLGFFAYFFIHANEPKWYHYAPLWVGVIFLVSTIVYYIKWNDQWSREHAQAEIRNKKLNADILRASWLAEMFFEGKDKDRLLPDMLLSRFSEGLFSDTLVSGPEHPSDQMVDLLKKISSVKVSKDTVEVTKSAAEEKK